MQITGQEGSSLVKAGHKHSRMKAACALWATHDTAGGLALKRIKQHKYMCQASNPASPSLNKKRPEEL
eukprot:1141791-Pelagomonas_calceolata.AAC.4